MKAGICRANGIDIHYLRTGGKKPPIVLLHGLMTNGACFTPQARALMDEFDVIMPDSRGHGNSSAPNQGYTYEILAEDVLGFIEALGINPVLLGHSMGGMTAAVVASRNPKLLRGLILVDPTFLTPERQKEVYESDVAQQLQIPYRPKEHRTREINESLAQARCQTSIHAFEILRPPNPDYRELIRILDIPSLLITGENSPVISPAMASELAQLNPYMEVVQIADTGHGIPFDQPERFSVEVKAFLFSLMDRFSTL